MLENTQQNNHIDYVFQEYDYVWSMSDMIEIYTQNLLHLIVKFGSKAEICWKLVELKFIDEKPSIKKN